MIKIGLTLSEAILEILFGKTSFAPFHHFWTHGGVGVCPIYSEKVRFSWLNLKMPEVHKKMKHAFKTINQCGVTALYRF